MHCNLAVALLLCTSGAAAAQDAADSSQEELWVEELDEATGKPFYYRSSDRATAWWPPEGAKVKHLDAAAKASGDAAKVTPAQGGAQAPKHAPKAAFARSSPWARICKGILRAWRAALAPFRRSTMRSTAHTRSRCANLYVSQSTIPGAGRGVFAARDFAPCDLVEESHYIELSAEDNLAISHKHVLRHYAFYHPADGSTNATSWRGAITLGHGSLFNHGGDARANTNYRPSSTRPESAFDFYAVREIKAGDELLVHYGYEPGSDSGFSKPEKGYFFAQPACPTLK